MLWTSERRLFMPFGAARGAIARASAAPDSAPTVNGSESLAGITTGADPLSFSLASQTYTAGDFLLAFCATYNQNVLSAAGGADDTYSEIQPGANSKLRSFSGTVVSSLDSSVTFDLSGGNRGVGGLITVSGAGGGVDISGNGGGTDQSPVMPSVTTTVNNTLVIGIIQAIGSHNLTTLEGALPSGWTFLFAGRTQASDFPAGTSQCTAAVAYKTQASAGATGAATWTNGLGASQAWLSHTIALAP